MNNTRQNYENEKKEKVLVENVYMVGVVPTVNIFQICFQPEWNAVQCTHIGQTLHSFRGNGIFSYSYWATTNNEKEEKRTKITKYAAQLQMKLTWNTWNGTWACIQRSVGCIHLNYHVTVILFIQAWNHKVWNWLQFEKRKRKNNIVCTIFHNIRVSTIFRAIKFQIYEQPGLTGQFYDYFDKIYYTILYFKCGQWSYSYLLSIIIWISHNERISREKYSKMWWKENYL